MKTLLRKIADELYFAGPGQWTRNPLGAKNFNSIDAVLEFIRQWHLNDVEIAFGFERGGKMTVVPATKLDVRHTKD
jgi:hypothetical protein